MSDSTLPETVVDEDSDTPPVQVDLRFAMIPEDLLYHPEATATAVRLFGAIVRHGSTAENCYPSHRRLAELIGVSIRSIPAPKKLLIRLGFISVTKRFNRKGEQISDGYIVHMTPGRTLQNAPPTLQNVPYPALENEDPPRSRTYPEREPVKESHKNERDPEHAPPSPIVEELCDHLARRMEGFSGHRPKRGASWVRDMDLLLRLGATAWVAEPISPERVRRAIDYVFDHLADRYNGFCWAAQIRSPAGLRAKWDKLDEAAKELRASAGAGPVETSAFPPPRSHEETTGVSQYPYKPWVPDDYDVPLLSPEENEAHHRELSATIAGMHRQKGRDLDAG